MRHSHVGAQGTEVDELTHPPGAQTDEPPKAGNVADLVRAPYIALNVRLEVVAERLGRVERLIEYAGVEAREDHVVRGHARAGAGALCERERQEPQQSRPSSERLADSPRQRELLASRQDVQAVAAALVDVNLHVGEELGDILNLVDDGAAASLSQKSPGIGLGQLALIGCLQVEVPKVREGLPAQRRLARLARPGQRHDRILSMEVRETAGDLSLNHGYQPIGCLCRLKVVPSICIARGRRSRLGGSSSCRRPRCRRRRGWTLR